MFKLSSFALVSLLLACGNSNAPAEQPEAPTQPAAAQPTAATASATGQSREEVFRAALVDFAENGGGDRFKSLLSARMIARVEKGQSEIDADPQRQDEVRAMARKMGLPESTTELEIRAAMWKAGLSKDLDALRTATVEVGADGDRLRATFPGTEIHQITVADEDGVLKIDEN